MQNAPSTYTAPQILGQHERTPFLRTQHYHGRCRHPLDHNKKRHELTPTS